MIRYFVVLIIKIYQILISPFYPLRCRFKPTCSEYCMQAIIKHGIIRGGYLSIKRLLRCRPGCEGGYDSCVD